MGRPKPGVHVVFRGRNPGLYHTWPECEAQVSRYPGAMHRKYETADKASVAWTEWQRTSGAHLEDQATPVLTGTPTGAELRVLGITGPAAASSPVLYTPSLKRPTARSSASPATSLHTADFRIVECVDLSGEFDDLSEPPAKRVRREAPDPMPEIQQAEVGEPDIIYLDEPPAIKEPEVTLSPEQERVVQLALSRRNIFLTGAAGCGKTVTLREILRRMKGTGRRVQVVAPTGIAALPLGGKTTYSFAGWNIDSFRKGIYELLQATRRKTIKAIREVDVLVVEEISMVENQFLERLNILFQHVLDNHLPFGGTQVIFLGDFHQLPPVKPFQHCLHCGESMQAHLEFVCVSKYCGKPVNQPPFKEGDKWAFKAPVWKQLDLRHVRLEQIHRQKDTRFQDILNKIRNSHTLSAQEWADLEGHKDLPENAFPVRLMSRVAHVRGFNQRQLAALKAQPKTWKAVDTCKKLVKSDTDQFDSSIPLKITEYRESLQDHNLPEDLTLKVGARVVLLQNLDHGSGLVNGSQGEILGFLKDPGEIETLLEKNSGDHKDFRRDSMMKYHSSNTDWRPLVRFTNGVTRVIPAIAAASMRGPGNRFEQYVVCRTQIPLALAWALSIHKSQGMTLEYVEVSSRDIFESGQLYVALSRATHLNGLKLTGFSRDQLPMDSTVLQFYMDTEWEKLKPHDEKSEERVAASDVVASLHSEAEPAISVAIDEPVPVLGFDEDQREVRVEILRGL